ncbi:hypothetical protein BC828DRAFT_409307, partial [Blastocladiella britannica]
MDPPSNSTVSLPWVLVDLILHAAVALGAPVRPSLDVAPDIYTPRVRCAAIQSIPGCYLVTAAAADRTDFVARWLEYGLPFTGRYGFVDDDKSKTAAMRAAATLAKYASRHGHTQFLDLLLLEEKDAAPSLFFQRTNVFECLRSASVANHLPVLSWWRERIETRTRLRPAVLDLPPLRIAEFTYFHDELFPGMDYGVCPTFQQCIGVGAQAAKDGASTAVLDWWLDQEMRYHHSCLGHTITLGGMLAHPNSRYASAVWWFTHFGTNRAAFELLPACPTYQYYIGTMATIELLLLLPLHLGADDKDPDKRWDHGAMMTGMTATNNVAALAWWHQHHALTTADVAKAARWRHYLPGAPRNWVQDARAIEITACNGAVQALDWWMEAGLPSSDFRRVFEAAARHGHILALEWAVKHKVTMKPKFAFAETVAHLDDVRTLDWWLRTPQFKFYAKAIDVDAISARGSLAMLAWWGQATQHDPHGRQFEFIYSHKAVDDASAGSHISVLAWWKASKYPLKYTHDTIDTASRQGDIQVLCWWKASGLELIYSEAAIDDVCALAGAVPILDWWAASGLPL